MKITAARYAAVTSTLALLVALGSTSYAAVKIGTKDLKDNAVTSVKVKNDALTGKDVKESTLARVPNADTALYAADAGTIAGTEVQPVHTRQDTSTGGRPHFVYVSDTLDIEVTCSTAANGTVVLSATTSAAAATIASVVVDDSSTPVTREVDLEGGAFTASSGAVNLLAGDDGNIAQLTFTYTDTDHMVQGTLLTDYSPFETEPCSVDGYISSVG